MNAQQLKNAILQEAIEGRLVPQDPNDEPASILLERIRAEKERLVREGKLKKSALKEIPFSEDEAPFEIPDSWVWCKLGWVGEWGAGATPAKGNPDFYNNGTIPWLRTGELNNGFVYDSEIKVTPKALEKCSLRMCEVGDVLIAMYGATIGKVAIAGIKLTTNQACCACTPLFVYNKYLMYYLMASKKTFIEMGEGGAQPNISREKIVAFPFALPPLEEQKRIVAKIEELLPKVEEYGKAQEALDKLNEELPDRLKKSILQEAITGRLVPQDPNDEPASVLLDKIRAEKKQLVKEGKFKKKDLEETPISEDEIPFEIPDSWEWIRIGNVYKTSSGGTPEKGHPEYYDGDIPWVKVGDMTSLYIDHTEDKITEEGLNSSSAKIFPADTILLAMYCNDAIGKSSILTKPMTTNQAICGLYPNPYLQKEYVYYAIQSNRRKLQEQSAGGAQKNINQKIVNELIIPLPPLAEQKRIVAKIEEVFKEIDKLKK